MKSPKESFHSQSYHRQEQGVRGGAWVKKE